MRTRLLTLLALVFVAVISAGCFGRKGAPGSEENPIRFYFMPLKGEEVFQANAPLIKKFIKTRTGLAVRTIHAPDFVTIVRAFGQRKADIAFMNTLGYLLARDWAGAEAHLRYVYGENYVSYRGEFISRADSGVRKSEDIAGKTVAFADPYSASGYLYPLKFLHERSIKPEREYFAGGHLKAVEAVYKGEADAAATYHTRPTSGGLERDARAELVSRYPDIMFKVKVVALTNEIPNGPVALHHGLPDDIKTKLVGACLEFARTREGRRTLANLYNITGLAVASDTDYDEVKKTIQDLGKTIQEMVPGGAPYYKTAIEPGLE